MSLPYSRTSVRRSPFVNRTNSRIKPTRLTLLLGLTLFASAALATSAFSAGALRQLIFGSASAVGHADHSPDNAAVAGSINYAMLPQGGSTLNVARRGHSATRLSDGRVLIAGGENDAGSLSDAEMFDPASGAFSVIGNMGSARTDHAAVRLNDGRVLLTGGRDGAGAVNTTEIFDPTTGAFASGPAMSVARAGHSATLFADGRVLIAAGDNSGSAEIFDSSIGAFSLVGANLISARSNHSAALLLDGRVLIVGGRDADGNELSSGEIFDTAAGVFSAVDGTLKVGRVRAHLRVLFDGKVQIIGGSNDGSMEIYDPMIEQFGAYAHVLPESDPCLGLPSQIMASQTRAALFHNGGADPLLDRVGHTLTELNGQALVVGGANSSGAVLGSFSVLVSSSASITTDKMDYAPSEVVTIAGRGFQPGETVRVKIHEDPHTPQERGFDAVADADGNFTGEYVVQSYDLYMKFIVGARGLSSGSTAQTTFTDAFKANLQGQSAVSTVNQTGTGTWIAGNLQNWQEQSLIPLRVTMTGGPVTNEPITVQFDHTKTQGGSIIPGIQDLTNFSTSAGVTMTTPVLSAPAGQDIWSYSFNVTLTGSTGDVFFNGTMSIGANNFVGSSLAMDGTPALGKLQIAKPAPVGTADLSITKTGPTSANPAQTVTYTLTYLNKTSSPNAAPNTQITDTLPSGLSYVGGSCTGGCTFNSSSNTLTWNLGSLAIGAGGSVTFQATVTGSVGQTVTNTGLIQSSAADPNLNDNDSSVSTNIVAGCTAASVVTHPTDATVTYGAATATFAAAASGSPTPTVQWQISSGGGPFTNLSNVAPYSGVTTGTLTITGPTVSLSGNQYRAVFTNTCGGTQTANSSAATLTVNKANATFTVTPYNVTYDGQPHTATVSTITGVNGETGATVGTVDVSGTTHTNAGSYLADPWTFTGTANYNNSNGTVDDNIDKANTSVSVDPKNSTYSEQTTNVTFTATVANTSTIAAINDGTVTFTIKQGATTVVSGTSATVSNGAASKQLTLPAGTAAGAYTIEATYNPGSNFNTSNGSGALTVGARATTTTAVNANAGFGDSSVTLSATVSATYSTVNAGSVTFQVKQGATNIGTATTDTTVVNGAASVSYSLPIGTAAGSYSIVATYNPSTNFVTSSDTKTLTIGQKQTSLSVAASPNPVQYSDATMLTATVTPATAGGQNVTGSVQFWINGTSVGSSAVSVSGGVATATLSPVVNLAPGSYPVTATFTSSNPNFTGSSTPFPAYSLGVSKEDMDVQQTGQLFFNTNAIGGTVDVPVSALVTEDDVQHGTVAWNTIATSDPAGPFTGLGLRVKFTAYQGTSASGTDPSCLATVPNGTATGSATAGCTIPGLKDGQYQVEMRLLINTHYVEITGTGALTVTDPGTGFTTGGGWFDDPNTGKRSNLGYTVKFLKNGSIQGNSLFIYRKTANIYGATATVTTTTTTGTGKKAVTTTTTTVINAPNETRAYNFIIKSNSMGTLNQLCSDSIGNEPCWATFTGGLNVKAVDRITGIEYTLGAGLIGNQASFQIDVTDNGEPGASSSVAPDQYAIKVTTSTGTYYQVGVPRTNLVAGGDGARIPLNGGNIQVRLRK